MGNTKENITLWQLLKIIASIIFASMALVGSVVSMILIPMFGIMILMLALSSILIVLLTPIIQTHIGFVIGGVIQVYALQLMTSMLIVIIYMLKWDTWLSYWLGMISFLTGSVISLMRNHNRSQKTIQGLELIRARAIGLSVNYRLLTRFILGIGTVMGTGILVITPIWDVHPSTILMGMIIGFGLLEFLIGSFRMLLVPGKLTRENQLTVIKAYQPAIAENFVLSGLCCISIFI